VQRSRCKRSCLCFPVQRFLKYANRANSHNGVIAVGCRRRRRRRRQRRSNDDGDDSDGETEFTSRLFHDFKRCVLLVSRSFSARENENLRSLIARRIHAIRDTKRSHLCFTLICSTW